MGGGGARGEDTWKRCWCVLTASSPEGRGKSRGRRARRREKGLDPPSHLGDGRGFRVAGGRGVDEGWMPTGGEAPMILSGLQPTLF